MTEKMYDWQEDARRSWALAIAEIRKRKVIAGELEPHNDEERQWLCRFE
jgi:hypothetical protein